MNWPTAGVVLASHFEQAVGAVTVIVPSRVAQHGIETDALHRHAGVQRGGDLAAHVVQSSSTLVPLDARLSHEDRAIVAGTYQGEQFLERAMTRSERG